MKNIILLILISVFISLTLFADVDSNDSFFRIDRILDDNDLEDNFFRIRDLSDDLNISEKRELYDEYNKSIAVPLLLNLIVPFGIGSFVQGDIGGGITLAVLDAVTLGTSALGAIYLTFYSEYQDYDSYYSSSYDETLYYIGLGSLLIAAGTEIASIIVKISRPIKKANEHNEELQNALKLNERYSMTIVPGFDLTSSGELTPAVSFKISY